MEAKDITSVLGLVWKPHEDVFCFKVRLPSSPLKTKRKIVSHTAKLYDPNGYLAPITVSAKILIQKLWLDGCDWDQVTPPAILDKLNPWVTQLPKIEAIRLPRWFNASPKSKIQLHGFSDASEKAYGAVIYIHVKNEGKPIDVSLVCAKTKVAPLKTITIP